MLQEKQVQVVMDGRPFLRGDPASAQVGRFGDALVGGIHLNWMTYDDFVWDHKSWRIYRDSSKTSIGTSALPPDTGFTVFTDSGAVPPGAGGRFFYYLRGLSPCTLTPGP